MMGLDVIRALKTNSDVKDALMSELNLSKGSDRYFDSFISRLENELTRDPATMEFHIRRIMVMIALGIQGSLLIRQSTKDVADAFCATRLGGEWGYEFGTLNLAQQSQSLIVDRAAISMT